MGEKVTGASCHAEAKVTKARIISQEDFFLVVLLFIPRFIFAFFAP